MKTLLFTILLFTGLITKAQDTLLLLNGKRFSGIAVDTSGFKIQFKTFRSGRKSKIKSFYRDDVFSINGDDGNEHIFYFPDMFTVNDYTVENMRFEVYGNMDARNKFRTKWVYPVGIASGFLAGFFLEGSVFSVFIVPIYLGVVQIPIVKIQPKTISKPVFFGNDFYKTGYNRSARMKRTKHAIISSFIGLIAGIGIYEITK